MATRKKKTRIPIPQQASDAVLFAFDRTCCICRTPDRPFQIHHIDDDPANNDVANLALLCLECHQKTQVRGGFAKSLTPGVVAHYRAEWLQIVAAKKRALLGQPAAQTLTPPARRTMTPEQARVHAARFRSLYGTFYKGVQLLQDYADQMMRAWGWDSPQQREERLQGLLREATSRIDATLDELRVEPGAHDVCSLYDHFRSLFDQCMSAIKADYARADDRKGFWARLSDASLVLTKSQMDSKARAILEAIQRHIQALDALT